MKNQYVYAHICSIWTEADRRAVRQTRQTYGQWIDRIPSLGGRDMTHARTMGKVSYITYVRFSDLVGGSVTCLATPNHRFVTGSTCLGACMRIRTLLQRYDWLSSGFLLRTVQRAIMLPMLTITSNRRQLQLHACNHKTHTR